MKPWARERDLLIEQTLAFVEGITGPNSPLRSALAKPSVAAPTLPPLTVPDRVLDIVAQSSEPPREISATGETDLTDEAHLKSESTTETPLEATVETTNLEAVSDSAQAEAVPDSVQALRPRPLVVASPVPALAVRDEIAQRVATFKARQARFQHDRERRYDEIFARAAPIPRNQVVH